MQFTPRLPKVSDIKDKVVLVRVDYNVPLSSDRTQVTNDNRIQASLDTLRFLIEHRAKIVLISHLGRPEGQVKPELSLQPTAKHLGKLLHQPIQFVPDCRGEQVTAAVSALKSGQVVMLENLRFYAEEEANDTQFAKELASHAEVFINEAFSTAHRAHASTEGITHFLPSFMGTAFATEVSTLHRLLTKPKRPFVMVIGGAKISDKVEAVVNLTHLADLVLVGGGVANNFLKADGFAIGKSYIQDTPADLKKKGVDYVAVAEHLIEETKPERILKDGYVPLPKIIYPTDVVVGTSLEAKASQIIDLANDGKVESDRVKPNWMFLDIGPRTIKLYQELINQAGTVFWNGPMGVFENPSFAAGTRHIAKAIAKTKATTVLGGGDTMAAIEQFGLTTEYDYISTAGGASLEFLAGKMLPGVKPLLEK